YHGYLLADSNDQFPSGIFRTRDAGKSWEPIRGPRCPSWLAGSFTHGGTGVLVGPWSFLSRIQDGQVEFTDIDVLAGPALRGVTQLKDRLLAVGDGGVLLSSPPSGKAWGFAESGLSADIRACLDFHAIASHGSKAWIAGRPGSFVLRSEDHGETWKLALTGHHLPLNAIHFLDEAKGWAVGAAGSILHTSDGGKTWSVQRQGGTRSAVLIAEPHARQMPVDTIAWLGAEQGHLVHTLSLLAPDPSSAHPRHAVAGDRLAAATRLVGGTSGEVFWHFPMPQY